MFANMKDKPKYEIYSQIRSSATSSSHTTTVNVGIVKEYISAVIPCIPAEYAIPIGILFKALGAKDAEEIITYIVEESNDLYDDIVDIMLPSFEYSYPCSNQKDALIYIGNKAKKYGTASTIETVEEDHVCVYEDCDEPATLGFNNKWYCGEKVDGQYTGHIAKELENGNYVIKLAHELDLLSTVKNPLQKAMIHALNILYDELFPSYGNNLKNKMYYLGYMVYSVLEVKLGRQKVEDRDLYSKKRVDTVGTLMGNLLYSGVKKMVNDMKSSMEKSITKKAKFRITDHVNGKHISKVFNGALSSGNWGGNNKRSKKNGVSQNYEQFNFTMKISNLRKLTAPINVEGKVTDPRLLHGSHYGIICPSDTPEGESVGLNKVFSLLSYVSLDKNPDTIISLMKNTWNVTMMEDFTAEMDVLEMTKIFVNGKWVASCSLESAKNITYDLKSMKRRCDIDFDTSIVLDTESLVNEIRICTDGGRIMRPYFIIEDGKLLCTKEFIDKIENEQLEWSKIISSGFIEMLDPDEVEFILLSESLDHYYSLSEEERKDYTHCDIHPGTILGVGATTVPWVETNQGPRNSYQTNMCKQAVGTPSTNFRAEIYGTHQFLHYGQRPIVASKLARKFLKYDEMPSGINATVAICPLRGHNQEDSIIINKSSIDRGLFRSSIIMVIEEKIQKHKNEVFRVPSRDHSRNFRNGNPRLLSANNPCVSPGDIIVKGDIIIGKCKILDEVSVDGKDNIDQSYILRECEFAQVLAVQRGYDAKNFEYIRVQICEQRLPEHGDKFASRIAQKGTLGLIVPEVDLPFCPDPYGAPVPDIIYNPLAFPSRMTIGQIIECLMGQKCSSASRSGEPYEKDHTVGNCTSFEHMSVDEISETLKKMGHPPLGKRMMIDGMSGRMMESLIYIGPTYIQRLKHQVRDKIHFRARGPTQVLSRQPTEGRGRNGGLKFGKFLPKWRLKSLLVYSIVGNTSKLRENPVVVLHMSFK